MLFCIFSSGRNHGSYGVSFDPESHLSWEDIFISVDHLMGQIILKHSKTDHFGKGMEIFLGATDDTI